MKVLWKGFLAKNHSWSIVAQNISRSLIKLGYNVDLFSTNGTSHFPDDLKKNLIGSVEEEPNSKIYGKNPDQNYDIQLSYTSLKNFESYLSHGNKNRFGIWTYEFIAKNSLPTGFAKGYKYCDWLLPPSQFAKQVFLESGIPENKMQVIPHGVNLDEINSANPYQLKTNKSFKILVNVAQVHKRKNLTGLLQMYGKAFNKNDDVCLVIKASNKKPTQKFELDFNDLLKSFKSDYPNHASIEVVTEFIPNIYSLYKSCDACFSASHTEAFGMTALEAQAVGLINIAPNYGGFLDFLNSENSLLIDGKEFFVKPDMVYWSYQPGSKAFMPSIDSGVEALRKAMSNFDSLKKEAELLAPICQENYNWDKICNQILSKVEL